MTGQLEELNNVHCVCHVYEWELLHKNVGFYQHAILIKI